jgi:hypothetical protein
MPGAAHDRRGRTVSADATTRGQPRVITIESEKPTAETRGYKGELRSLSGLRSLLGDKADKAEEPKTT